MVLLFQFYGIVNVVFAFNAEMPLVKSVHLVKVDGITAHHLPVDLLGKQPVADKGQGRESLEGGASKKFLNFQENRSVDDSPCNEKFLVNGGEGPARISSDSVEHVPFLMETSPGLERS